LKELLPTNLSICGASALHLTDLVMNRPRYITTVDPNDPLHERTILVLNALTWSSVRIGAAALCKSIEL